MPDDENHEKPDAIEDIRKGLGLLFRAAKTAVDQLPTKKLEDVVLTGAREVGRAIENVTNTIDKQVFKRDAPPPAEVPAGTEPPKADAAPSPAPTSPANAATTTPATAKAPPVASAVTPPTTNANASADDKPKGPRVG